MTTTQEALEKAKKLLSQLRKLKHAFVMDSEFNAAVYLRAAEKEILQTHPDLDSESSRPERKACRWIIKKSTLGKYFVYVAHKGMEVGTVIQGYRPEGACFVCGEKIKVVK